MGKNIDPNEIAKFDNLAAEWWDLNGSNRALHAINSPRLEFILNTTALTEKKVLDIGCGGGILAESMAKQGAHVTAIDMAHELLNVAKEHAEEQSLNIDYQLTSAEELAVKMPQQFDVITCMEMLEHVPDPKAVITACAQLIKPSGLIFFSTINRTLKAYLLAIIGAEYVLHWLPIGTHDYEKLIKPSELDAWARANNLHLTQLRGMICNPLTKQFSLSDDSQVNYLACYQLG